jgi:hypothetical protein
MVVYYNFLEDTFSWESLLLLAFSDCGVLIVGFRFCAVANPGGAGGTCSRGWLLCRPAFMLSQGKRGLLNMRGQVGCQLAHEAGCSYSRPGQLVEVLRGVTYSSQEYFSTNRPRQAPPFSSRNHQPRRLVVLPVLPELQGCGRAAVCTRRDRLVRGSPQNMVDATDTCVPSVCHGDPLPRIAPSR